MDHPTRAVTTAPENTRSTGASPLTGPWRLAVALIAAAVAVLGLFGFVISFDTVNQAAMPRYGPLAWVIPASIDLGILLFSVLDILLARLDMRITWLRLIPWSLTAVTVYLNVAGQSDLFGVVSHAALPGLWVIAVEVGAHVVRVRAGLAAGTRMDTIRKSRWLLALPSTFALWRRMVLWEIRSYPVALQRERERRLAKTDLQDRYGRAWRWRAPRRLRALYRLGELAPAAAVPGDATHVPAPGQPLAHEYTPPGTPGTPHPHDVPGTALRAPGGVPGALAAPPAATLPPVLAYVPAPDDLYPVAVTRYAEEIAAGTVPPLRRIKEELRVGQTRAERIQVYLTELARTRSCTSPQVQATAATFYEPTVVNGSATPHAIPMTTTEVS